jgi:hypothetical protein
MLEPYVIFLAILLLGTLCVLAADCCYYLRYRKTRVLERACCYSLQRRGWFMFWVGAAIGALAVTCLMRML